MLLRTTGDGAARASARRGGRPEYLRRRYGPRNRASRSPARRLPGGETRPCRRTARRSMSGPGEGMRPDCWPRGGHSKEEDDRFATRRWRPSLRASTLPQRRSDAIYYVGGFADEPFTSCGRLLGDFPEASGIAVVGGGRRGWGFSHLVEVAAGHAVELR